MTEQTNHHCKKLDSDETVFNEYGYHYSIYQYEGDKDWYYFTGEYHHVIYFCPFCGKELK